MTLDLANITKADVYAAAQDLGERLARQIEINQVLRAENIALAEDIDLASRPCLACDIVHRHYTKGGSTSKHFLTRHANCLTRFTQTPWG